MLCAFFKKMVVSADVDPDVPEDATIARLLVIASRLYLDTERVRTHVKAMLGSVLEELAENLHGQRVRLGSVRDAARCLKLFSATST
jgi:hypothetical protein